MCICTALYYAKKKRKTCFLFVYCFFFIYSLKKRNKNKTVHLYKVHWVFTQNLHPSQLSVHVLHSHRVTKGYLIIRCCLLPHEIDISRGTVTFGEQQCI